MAWLHLLPDYVVFPVVAAPLAGAVAAAPYIRRRLWPRTALGSQGSEMMDGFFALASAVAILLTLSLVEAERVYHHVEEQVGKEAATLNDLDRTITRYGDPGIAVLRPHLVTYGESIAGEEWALMHHGGRSAAADEAYTEVSKTLRAVEPTSHRQQIMFTEALRQIDDLSDLRDERVDAAKVTLPPIYWYTTLTMLLLMVLIAAMIEPTRHRTWITAIIASAIGHLMALAVIFDAPFQGDGSISPEPFRHALEQMAARH